MHHLKIDDLSAAYGDTPVLRGVSLGVERGEVVTLIGASGSGKSTLLRVLVGLLRPRSGQVILNGVPVDYGNKKAVRAVRDQIAIVFQQFNLFQNMTALRNVTIAPIKIKKRDRREVEEEARRLLEKVGLGDKMHVYPDELSGGQQQRVAIARALALRPEILLLDEVTSALDPELVSEVLDTIRLLAAEGMTMLIISHEMGFVREVASKVAFLDNGRILEIGSPQEIFDSPREPRTREFVGRILRH
ncbi:MAG: amino acid ABC transporter ATP-binding protein [Deltaproteobacteria bacterium]|nr:amino acid ABC transporter ATP-binding protein [Deltaproteobacteria bacterium]